MPDGSSGVTVSGCTATTLPMPKKLCLEPSCGRVTDTGRCSEHERNRHLARTHLTEIYVRDKGICQLCGEGTPAPHTLPGKPESATLHHTRGTSDHLEDLTLAHLICNQQAG